MQKLQGITKTTDRFDCIKAEFFSKVEDKIKTNLRLQKDAYNK